MAVNDIPRPRSYPQQLGDMIDAVTSRVGIRRLKVGAPLLSVLEAAAQSDVRQSQDIFNTLNATSLDNAEGIALDRIGNDDGVPRRRLSKATGSVTITDTSFAKISSKLFQGAPAPIVGSVVVNVETAFGWPSSGSIYLGRGTPNIEGPLTYASLTDNGSYWSVNLVTPTTRFHNKGEEVVVAQGGNRIIDSGQFVATAQGALTTAVQFYTAYEAQIPDGEVSATAITVIASIAGVVGNVPAESVKEFSGGTPFPGAAVLNAKPFITGRDTETDNSYRERIRTARNSRQRGTDLAIENAVIDAVSVDENKRISSASIVRRPGQPSNLYIDDGSGYEEVPAGVGIEVLVDSATGGERDFQVLNRPVSKAYLQSRNAAPFSLLDGTKLSISVGGVITTHTFDSSEFTSISAGSAYEVVASINADPSLLWAARTAESGTKVVIISREETNEDLLVVAVNAPDTDANAALQLPVSKQFTTLLYKNDRLLSKDGSPAAVRSRSFVDWNNFTGNQTLIIAIDGTPVTTYTWIDQDFIDAGTVYNNVGKNSLAAWVDVINLKIPGITASIENDKIVLTSNRGRSAKAAIIISGGSLLGNFVFEASSSFGTALDYSLDRGTGQIVTTAQLSATDRLTLGSSWTRAFLEAGPIGPTAVGAEFSNWFVVDGAPSIITHGVGAATPLTATVEKVMEHGLRIRVAATTTADAFANVAAGDWAIFWDPDADLPTALRKAWRVVEVQLDGLLKNRIVLEKRAAWSPRFQAGVTALVPSGVLLAQVLATGGYTHEFGTRGTWTHYGKAVTDQCEVFNPNTGSWTATGAMATARAFHTASILPDGKVIVVGGYDRSGAILATSEIWDPTTGLWTAGPVLAVPRAEHAATVLVSGKVLITGGFTTGGAATASTVEYNQGTNTFINPVNMVGARAGHGAVLLPTGAGVAGAEQNNVLVIGGVAGGVSLQTVERYDVAAPAWSAKNGMGVGSERAYFGCAVAATQKVLAVGDSEFTATFSTDQRAEYQVYDVSTNTWTASAVVEAGWRFTDKRYGAVKSPTNSAVICYGGVFESGGIKSLRHKRFDGAALTWSTLTASSFATAGVERTCVHGVQLNGPASADRTLFYGGVSTGNMATAGEHGPAVATHEVWNDDTSLWEVPDDSTALLNGTLGLRGLAFVRTVNDLQKVIMPVSASYTSPTFAAVLNAGLEGVTAEVYRTSKLRVQTNRFDIAGDITLVASTNAAALGLPVADPETNLVGHFGSVEAGGSGLGTPFDFQVHMLTATAGAPHTVDAAATVYIAQLSNNLYDAPPPSGSTMLGLRRWRDGLNPNFWAGTWTAGNDKSVAEHGNTKNTRSVVAALEAQATDRTRIGIRRLPQQDYVTATPVVFAAPYAMGPRDDLTVVVDEDTDTKRFSTPLWRRLKPAGTTYSSQVALRDFDGGNTTLAVTFGQTYDFDDYAVYMKARAKSHTADVTKRIIWRYFRHGGEGNSVMMRYIYPDEASAALAVSIDHAQVSVTNALGGPIKIFANVALGSGAAKVASALTANCRIGLARCNQTSGVWDVYVMTGFTVVAAERTSAVGTTRLRLQVPNNGIVAQGPQDCGIVATNVMWFEATNPTPTTLYSGSFVVAAVTAFNAGTGQQDIYVPSFVLHDGTSVLPLTLNPGTVSFDNSQETTFDPTTAAGDLCRLDAGALPAAYTATTMRIAGFGRQYLRCRSLDLTTGGFVTTPVWTQLVDTTDVHIFGGPTQTATAVAAAVNALAGDTSTSPVSATVVGDGTGTIALATWDELNDKTAGYSLSDGINYVQRTIDPPSLVTDTQLLFKDPITADLSTDSDWANEDVRIVPILATDVAAWLNTPVVSGLFSAAEIDVSDDGRRLQIGTLTAGSGGAVEIQGGTANQTTSAVSGAARLNTRTGGAVKNTFISTVRRAEADGLIGGRYVSIDNTYVLPKVPFWNSATAVSSIAADGLWTTAVAPYSVVASIDEVRVHVESISGFTALHIGYTSNSSVFTTAQLAEFGYIYLTTPVLNRSDLPALASANQGTFRIVRSTANQHGVTVWIENDNAIDQIGVCKIKVLTADSMVAGDTWTVSTALFGDANRGTWTVTEVGATVSGTEQYVSSNFRVDTASATPSALTVSTLFGTSSNLVQHHEGVPARLFKKILTIAPNQSDGSFLDVQFDTSAGYQVVSASAGSIINALDKLDFPLGINTGVDGYSYGTGLIGEANRIVYGDPSDEATYPGYASTGASILTSGPLVKRIKLALSLRVQSGLASEDLADRVRSAVASVINQTGVGVAISLSDVVTAAGSVNGVIAVSVVSPTFSSSSDIIVLGPSEKPLVLDLQTDIQIAFVGE